MTTFAKASAVKSAYHLDDERAIRTGRLVDDWMKAGLLTPEQRALVMPQLAVELRRTNLFLRITLFVFGGVILHSALGLLAIMLTDVVNATAAGVICTLAGAACLWLASWLVGRYDLYRFGVEEAVALTAPALIGAGAGLFVVESDWGLRLGLAAAAATLAVLFIRFGYVYAAVMAMAVAAALPFLVGDNEMVQRGSAIAVLAVTATWARRAREPHGGEYPADALAVIEAAAWLGIYLLLNLVVSSGISRLERASAVHWFTFAAIWLMPAAGLAIALRRRERPLLLVSLAMALTTILTSKTYLGWPQYEWDPIVFGLILIGVALAVRRWLAAGAGGERHGYTASRLVASDTAHLGHLAIVSAAHTDVPVAESTPPTNPGIGGGGHSGGAGAGGSF